jgi:hypothetical protein
LFIDGLEEFEGDHGELVKVIKRLNNLPGVKICVSSRPWSVFNDAFERSPSLKVQDMTWNDIICYIDGHFAGLPAFVELQSGDPDETARLKHGIAEKADGVFLWVSVVVRTLAERLTDGDRLGHLHAIVDQLPGDIEALFEAIKRKINSRHTKQSSQYFLLLLEAQRQNVMMPPSAVTFFLAEEDDASLVNRDFCNTSENKRSWMISTMRRRLNSRTMGLVETLKNGSVTFLHRTVLEWVTRPESLTAIKRDASTAFNPNLELFKARTTETSAAPVTTSAHGCWLLVHVSLLHASLTSHRPEDKERLVQTFERLQSYMNPLNPYLVEPHIPGGRFRHCAFSYGQGGQGRFP